MDDREESSVSGPEMTSEEAVRVVTGRSPITLPVAPTASAPTGPTHLKSTGSYPVNKGKAVVIQFRDEKGNAYEWGVNCRSLIECANHMRRAGRGRS